MSVCLYRYVKGIDYGSPRVPETVKWDGVGLIVYKRDATGRSGTTPIPAIVSLHRLSRKALPIGSTTELVLEGRAEAQVACQYNRVVLTFANLLPNAISDAVKDGLDQLRDTRLVVGVGGFGLALRDDAADSHRLVPHVKRQTGYATAFHLIVGDTLSFKAEGGYTFVDCF